MAAMADTDETNPENADTTDGGDGQLGDAGQKALAAERQARRAAERQMKDLQKQLDSTTAKVQEYEDQQKTETQRLTETVTKLEAEIAARDEAAARAALIAEVAEAKDVPASLLKGKTREELEASADKLADWRGEASPAPAALRKRGLLSGAAPLPDGATKKDKAAASLRALRSGL